MTGESLILAFYVQHGEVHAVTDAEDDNTELTFGSVHEAARFLFEWGTRQTSVLLPVALVLSAGAEILS